MAKKKDAAAPTEVPELEYRVYRDTKEDKSRVETHVTVSPAGGIELGEKLAGKFRVEMLKSGSAVHEWRIDKPAGTTVSFGNTQGATH